MALLLVSRHYFIDKSNSYSDKTNLIITITWGISSIIFILCSITLPHTNKIYTLINAISMTINFVVIFMFLYKLDYKKKNLE